MSPHSAIRHSLFLAVCLVHATAGLAGPMVDEEAGPIGPSVDLSSVGARFLSAAIADRDQDFRARLSPSLTTTGDVPLGGWNETCIAVNPTNPKNIAYASLFELRVSTNGGVTWKPGIVPTLPAGFVSQGDPSVAFDADGRLFFSYLGSPLGQYSQFLGNDIFLAQCDPATGTILAGYPVNVSQQVGIPATQGAQNDKGWLAVDANPSSPYVNRLQLIWTLFVSPGTTGSRVLTTHSSDHGLTWSATVQIGGSGPNLKWPTHIATAPNGDVYAAFHNQPGFSGGAPNGTSGSIDVYRSTDGGTTFPQVTQAFTPGAADMTANVQTASLGRIPGTRFLLQGGVQPWVLPDPKVDGRVYVVACDDPDNNVSAGDAANVYIARSDNRGLNWGPPRRVDGDPGGAFQVMPTAAIDPGTGAITVLYYDNRGGARNAGGDFLLDVYAAVSLDGGDTFLPDQRINDLPFDPDAGARCRYGCGPLVSQPWTGPGTRAFAVATSGHVLSYDGLGWTGSFFTSAPKFGVWGASDTDVFTCGSAGEILHYDGATFVGQLSGTLQNLFDIDGRSGSDVYAVGGHGTVVHYDGDSWTPLDPGTTEDLHDVWVNPTGDVWVVGAHGTALRYDGTSWTPLPVGAVDPLFSVWGSSDSDVYTTAAPGRLFHWDGVSWATVDTGLSAALGLWGSSPSDVLMLGFGRLRRYDGASWQPEDISEELLWKAHGSAGSNVFVTGEDGFIAHYDGSAWTQQSNPLTPTAPTLRIGEYIGVAATAGRAFAVWCGNSPGPEYLNQQAIFDAFNTNPNAPPLAAQVDFDPNVLNLSSHAPRATVYIESQEFDVSSIDFSSVRLAGSVSPLPKVAVLGDHDADQIPDLMLKFDRETLAPLLVIGDNSLPVTGTLLTGESFEGSDDIRVIDPQGGHLSASVVPNPPNPSAALRFQTKVVGAVTAKIFDVQGRLVRTLSASQFMDPGAHELQFDGRDERGRMLSTGLYFYRVEAGGETATGQFTVLK